MGTWFCLSVVGWMKADLKEVGYKKWRDLCELKGIVHPKMKITPMNYSPLSHPIGIYDFLLSDEYNQSSITKCPGSTSVYVFYALKLGRARIFFNLTPTVFI